LSKVTRVREIDGLFTGIVEELGTVVSFNDSRLSIESHRVIEDLSLGDSISVNGACLTAISLTPKTFTVELSPETLRRTNFSSVKKGTILNLERALAANARLGGHIVQGHIDACGQISSERPEGDSIIRNIRAPKRLMRYVIEKGFVAIDGISLTVVKKFSSSFTISVIPYTLENTNMKWRQPKDSVNLEVDILGKYVESLFGGR